VFIIGAGVMGTTLAAKLSRAGVPVAGVHGRQSELSEAASALSGVLGTSGELPAILSDSEVVIIAVRDSRIPEVVKRLVDEKRVRKDQVLLHTSGNRPAAEMLGHAREYVRGLGTLHPLIAVTDAPGTLENLRGAAFGIEGDDLGRTVAAKLVRMMGGRPLQLKSESMALYHTGAVVASNYVVALADLARSLLVAAGVPESEALPALLPLMSSAVRNLAEVGLPSAMTGPVVRGDVTSVERHVSALEERAPDLLDAYRRLGQEVLRIARKRVPDLDDGAVEKMAALFRGAGEPRRAGGARLPQEGASPAHAPAGRAASAPKKKR
jgi:predicted short-subunit dehydrogenase-like oxidoreductase (DUF2520 family)